MKRHLISIFIFLSCSFFSYSQIGKGVSVVFGKSTGGLYPSILRTGFLTGTGGHSLNKSNTFGIRYFSDFNAKEKMGYEIGLNFLKAKIEFISDADPDLDPEIRNFMLLSTPVYISHSFWKYFYLNYGLMLDYQEYNEEKKLGIGIGVGLGGKYDINKYFIFINPKYEKHLFLNKEMGLIEFGLMLGFGYKFWNVLKTFSLKHYGVGKYEWVDKVLKVCFEYFF